MAIDVSKRIEKIGDIEDKLKSVIHDKEQQEFALREIISIALESKTSLDNVTEIYTTMAPVLNEKGYGNFEQVELTQSLSNISALSSAREDEIRKALEALVVSFEKGKMYGDEFRTIEKNNVKVLESIARGLGINLEELRKLATNGGVSSEEIFEALAIKDAQYLKDQVKKLPVTNYISKIGEQFGKITTGSLNGINPLRDRQKNKNKLTKNNPNNKAQDQVNVEVDVVLQVNEEIIDTDVLNAKKEIEMQYVPAKSQAQEAAQEVVDKTHQIEEQAKEAVGEICVAKKEFEVQLVPTAPKMSLVNPQIEKAVNETLDEVQEKIVPVEIELEVNEQELNSLNSNIKKRLEKPKQAVNLQKNQISSKPKAYVANASFAKANPKNKPDVEPKNQVLDAAYLQEDVKKFAETNSNLQKSFENTLPQSSADQVSQYNEEIIQTTNSISNLIEKQQGLMEIADEALLQTKEAGDANQAYWEDWIEGMESKLSNFNAMISDWLNNFTNSFSNALFEIVRGTQSVSDAFRNMLSGLVENTVRAITQMVAQYLTLAAVKAIAGIPPGVPTSAQAGGGIFGSYLNAAPLIGMSHAGFDEIPKTGTWLLEKGERVTTAQTSAKLDRVLDEVITSNYYNSRNTSVTNQINVRGNVDNRTASQIALETDRRLKRADRRFGNG